MPLCLADVLLIASVRFVSCTLEFCLFPASMCAGLCSMCVMVLAHLFSFFRYPIDICLLQQRSWWNSLSCYDSFFSPSFWVMPCLKNVKCESVIIKIKKRQKGFGFSGYEKRCGLLFLCSDYWFVKRRIHVGNSVMALLKDAKAIGADAPMHLDAIGFLICFLSL